MEYTTLKKEISSFIQFYKTVKMRMIRENSVKDELGVRIKISEKLHNRH